MRHQKGQLYRKGSGWYLRYYDTLIEPDGTPKRKLLTRKVAPYCSRYHCKEDVRPLVEEFLAPINSGKLQPESTMTLTQFWESAYWPHVQAAKRPATARSYRQMWRDYLKDRCGESRLRDFRCVDGEKALDDLDRRRHFSHSSYKRMKALLSALFKHAKRLGLLDGANPMQDVSIPKGKEAAETYAYSLGEIAGMVAVLPEPAATAVAVAAFAGLGKSELRGFRWEDYAGQEIKVSQSAWVGNIGQGRKVYVTPGKTRKRRGSIPVVKQLANKLDTHRLRHGNPQSGWVFPAATDPDKPLDFDNLVNRVIKPTLEKANIAWHGWHAFRRGLGTNLYTLGATDKTVQAALRHANISTTMAYYVKPLPEDSLRAMQALEQAISQELTVH